MSQGNCLLGAIILLFQHRTVKIRSLNRPGRLPHFYVIGRDGYKYHYKRTEHLLPKKVSFLWFKGKFEMIKKSKD